MGEIIAYLNRLLKNAYLSRVSRDFSHPSSLRRTTKRLTPQDFEGPPKRDFASSTCI
jgi:hypothetical protein